MKDKSLAMDVIEASKKKVYLAIVAFTISLIALIVTNVYWIARLL